MALTLTSAAFQHGSDIPPRYTCEGDNRSPPLQWEGAPAGAKSLVLIVDDPDAPDPQAPKRTWVHWLLYNLPPRDGTLPEAVSESDLSSGALQGRNDSKRIGYGSPCPPIGRHRYFFKLYALDSLLPDLNTPTKGELLDAMQGHVLEQAELVGLYQRQ